jgi:drug/metabolite transporter (DMT)-like permease
VTQTQPTAASRLQLLAAAFLFSTGGAAIKATSFSGWQVAAFRSLVAAIALFLLVPAARKSWSRRTLLVSLGYAGTLVLFVLANKLTTSANAIFLQDTAPLYMLLLGPWLLREPVRRSDFLLMVVIAAGMSLFFVSGQEVQRTAPDPLRGNIIAAFAGVCWALTIGGLRWIETASSGRESGMATVVAGNLMACLICLPKALPLSAPTMSDWAVILYLGVFQIGIAYIFVTRAMRRTPALEASLLLLAEPAMNPVWAWLVHDERPGGLAIVGGALILAATISRTIARSSNVADSR